MIILFFRSSLRVRIWCFSCIFLMVRWCVIIWLGICVLVVSVVFICNWFFFWGLRMEFMVLL